MIELENVAIVGPTPEAIEDLRSDFEWSALDWLERASIAEIEGRQADAAAALIVAGIAAQVACGGER